jgi:hypothetical protein
MLQSTIFTINIRTYVIGNQSNVEETLGGFYVQNIPESAEKIREIIIIKLVGLCPACAHTRLFGLNNTPKGALRAFPPPIAASLLFIHTQKNNLQNVGRPRYWSAKIDDISYPDVHSKNTII